MRRTLKRLVLGVAGTVMAQAAWGQGCYVSGAFGMDFGAVSASGKTAVSSVTYTCAPDYSGSGNTYYYTVCLHLGAGDWSLGQPTRRMGNYNGGFLAYDLFADPAHTQPIGGLGSTPAYVLTLAVAPGAPQTGHAQVHGYVYPGQSVPAAHVYQEQGIQGVLRWRYSSTAFPVASAHCGSDGTGGGATGFNTSGVLATFENGCSLVASDQDFGQSTPPEQARRGQAEIRLQCAAGTPWRMGLDAGQHANGGARRMAAAANAFVTYELHRDAGRTLGWGNVEGTMLAGNTDAAGNPQEITVYGLVPAQPDAVPGIYRDTVVVTLYY